MNWVSDGDPIQPAGIEGQGFSRLVLGDSVPCALCQKEEK